MADNTEHDNKDAFASEIKKYFSENNYGAAEEACARFVMHAPDSYMPYYYYGVCAFFKSEYSTAIDYLLKATTINPEHADSYACLGQCYMYCNEKSEAISNFKKALTINPDNFNSLNLLGMAYIEANYISHALHFLERALKIKPDNIVCRSNLAKALLLFGESEKAYKTLEVALHIEPDSLLLNMQLAEIYVSVGKTKEALSIFKKCIDLDNTSGDAYYCYVKAKTITSDDNDIVRSMEQSENTQITHQQRARICFALAKAYDDLGNYDKAFDAAIKGNALLNTNLDMNTNISKSKAIRSVFNKSFIASNQVTIDKTIAPIFVVGMPRSGSTLIDQILSTHHDVTSLGESSLITELISVIKSRKNTKSVSNFPECTLDLDNGDILSCREYVRVFLENRNIHSKYFVDKNLFNFETLGLITILFPNAKILNINRNPLDTGLSNFMTCFTYNNMAWSNQLESIGAFYNYYHGLMNFWNDVIPDNILNVNYEDITNNTEITLHSVFDFINIEWDSGVLDFYQNARNVHTASVWQVRKPIYKKSVERWVLYAKHLQPLVSSLGEYAEPYKIALEKYGLKVNSNNPSTTE